MSDRVCLRCFQSPCECREPRTARMEPKEQIKALRRRNAMLEGLLKEAWVWSTDRLGQRTDDIDVHALRGILSRGDADSPVKAALEEGSR